MAARARRSALRSRSAAGTKGTPRRMALLKSKPQSARNAMDDAWQLNTASVPLPASGKSQKLKGRAVHRRVEGLKAKQHTPYCSTVMCLHDSCTLEKRSEGVSRRSKVVALEALRPVNSRSKLQKAKCGSAIASASASRLASKLSRVTSIAPPSACGRAPDVCRAGGPMRNKRTSRHARAEIVAVSRSARRARARCFHLLGGFEDGDTRARISEDELATPRRSSRRRRRRRDDERGSLQGSPRSNPRLFPARRRRSKSSLEVGTR